MTKYEYRISPEDDRLVQVRRVTGKPMGNNSRGASWRRYMLCSSPAAALRILSMLLEPERETVTL